MAFCGNCGTQLNEGAKFCPKCGSSVVSSCQRQQAYQPQQEEEKSFFTSLFHNIWFWIVIVILGLAIVYGARNLSDDLEKEVKKEMVKQCKEKGHTLVVNDFVLVKEDDTHYSGLAKCTLDGAPIDLNVIVVTDGSKFVAEWAPTDEYLLPSLDNLWDF